MTHPAWHEMGTLMGLKEPMLLRLSLCIDTQRPRPCWVDEHWRQIRVDPEEETKVRAHLRGMSKGTNSFVWNGLRCTIRPSHIDHELEEIERENRKYLTEIGAARRIAGEDVHAQLPWWLRAWRRLKGKR